MQVLGAPVAQLAQRVAPISTAPPQPMSVSFIGAEVVSLCFDEKESDMFRTLTRRFNEWSRIRRDIQRLKRLDDYLLADTGIERECIPHHVRHGR